MFAINTSKGAGSYVSARQISDESEMVAGETFTLDELPDGVEDMVLASNLTSLRAKNASDRDKEKDARADQQLNSDLVDSILEAAAGGGTLAQMKAKFRSTYRGKL